MSVIFITGATSGIGRAAVERFAGEGWQVIAAGRRKERLDELAKTFPGKILPLQLDVTDAKAVQAAFDGLKAPFAPVDVLLNNAGLALGTAPAQACSLEDWNTMVDTNIKGVMTCARVVLPGMVERKSGHILNIGSIAGSYAYPGGNVYCSSKAFVEQFSRTLRCDLHGTGVRVTNIEPGLLETEFSKVRMKGDNTAADKLYENADPLVAKDIADCIWWAVTMPKHVNINCIEVMPVSQSHGGLRVYKGE